MADFSAETAQWQTEVNRLAPLAELESIQHRYHRGVGYLAGSGDEFAFAKTMLAKIQQTQRDQDTLDALNAYMILSDDPTSATDPTKLATLAQMLAANPCFAYAKLALRKQIARQPAYVGDPLAQSQLLQSMYR